LKDINRGLIQEVKENEEIDRHSHLDIEETKRTSKHGEASLPTNTVKLQVTNPTVTNANGATTCTFVISDVLNIGTPAGAKTFDLGNNKYFVLVSIA
jgi:hypothetical protein